MGNKIFVLKFEYYDALIGEENTKIGKKELWWNLMGHDWFVNHVFKLLFWS